MNIQIFQNCEVTIRNNRFILGLNAEHISCNSSIFFDNFVDIKLQITKKTKVQIKNNIRKISHIYKNI